MSDSPRAADLVALVEAQIRRQVSTDARLVVAISGGADSMVLLDIACRLRALWRAPLRALHVHHGISPNADLWEAFCRQACEARGVALQVERGRVQVRAGESLEEKARELRYACFAQVDADWILLGHHLDDQCETFFLRVLRGSGLQGMLAMPVSRPLEGAASGPRLLRPLLGVTRQQVLEYGREQTLAWIEDESNVDESFARNFLRAQIMPRIETRFPGYRQAIERALMDLGDAAAVVQARTDRDLADVCEGGVLRLGRMTDWTPHRAMSLLRAFIGLHGGRAPSRARLQEVWRQLRDAGRDAQVRVALDAGELRRYRDEVHWLRGPVTEGIEGDLVWRGESHLTLPVGMGALGISQTQGAGVRLEFMTPGQVRVVSASGGLRFKSDHDRPTRTLKNLFQERAVPPWLRPLTPVLQRGAETLWVAGLGYDCRVVAAAGEPAMCVDWLTAPLAKG